MKIKAALQLLLLNMGMDDPGVPVFHIPVGFRRLAHKCGPLPYLCCNESFNLENCKNCYLAKNGSNMLASKGQTYCPDPANDEGKDCRSTPDNKKDTDCFGSTTCFDNPVSKINSVKRTVTIDPLAAPTQFELFGELFPILDPTNDPGCDLKLLMESCTLTLASGSTTINIGPGQHVETAGTILQVNHSAAPPDGTFNFDITC
jgi:hypothetical protein